jgi:sulfur relay (sulfurtransferase) complex TusBCD TusD component (DsrE family)
MTKSKKEYLLIVNDGPYGNERPDNALPVAMNLTKREEAATSP